MKCLPLARFAPLLLACWMQPGHAAIFCADSATELRDAMTTAASNGEDDEIRIKTGGYAGPHPVNAASAFIYSLEEDFDVLLQGGWVTRNLIDCGGRLTAPEQTTLGGSDVRTALLLISTANSAGGFALENLTIEEGETAGRGGGLDQVGDYAGTLRIERVYFRDNHADGFAAGASLHGSGSIVLRNNLFFGNRCGNRFCAAEVFVQSDDTTTVRGFIGNNTVVANACDDAVECGGSGLGVYGNGRFVVYNNAFAFNQSVDLDVNSATGNVAVLNNNLLEMSGTPASTSGNLAVEDPQFESLLGLDFRLRSESPLRDAGSAAQPPGDADFNGFKRINGDGVDIGAFENDTVMFLDGFETTP